MADEFNRKKYTDEELKKVTEEITKDHIKYTLPMALDRGYSEKDLKELHNLIGSWILKEKPIDDLISIFSGEPCSHQATYEKQPEFESVFGPGLKEIGMPKPIKETLNAVYSLGGIACAEDVANLTNKRQNMVSKYLQELWGAGLLMTRHRKKRVVYYSVPERAFEDTLKKIKEGDINAIKNELDLYVYNKKIMDEQLNTLIASSKENGKITVDGALITYRE